MTSRILQKNQVCLVERERDGDTYTLRVRERRRLTYCARSSCKGNCTLTYRNKVYCSVKRFCIRLRKLCESDGLYIFPSYWEKLMNLLSYSKLLNFSCFLLSYSFCILIREVSHLPPDRIIRRMGEVYLFITFILFIILEIYFHIPPFFYF